VVYVNLPVKVSIYLFIYLSKFNWYLYIYLSNYLFIYLTIYLIANEFSLVSGIDSKDSIDSSKSKPLDTRSIDNKLSIDNIPDPYVAQKLYKQGIYLSI
jgi:hypothetical protein